MEGIQFAAARDGTKLAHRIIKGKGRGRCLLIHSLALDMSFWDRVVPYLTDHADVLVYDCRGHGKSDKLLGPYTIELFADDLADLMDAIGWRRATVCGASMGGTVAISFAAAYPDRVASLALFDTTCWYGPEAPAQWAERAKTALDEGLHELIGFQKTRWFSDAFRAKNSAVVDQTLAVFLANDVRAYAETCRMLGTVDKRAALKDFRMPCAILVGAEDYATPVTMARVLESNIPGAALDVIENARHLTPIEIPIIVAGKIIEMVKAAS
jgi:3-oxoadipate enol-lactonase